MQKMVSGFIPPKVDSNNRTENTRSSSQTVLGNRVIINNYGFHRMFIPLTSKQANMLYAVPTKKVAHHTTDTYTEA